MRDGVRDIPIEDFAPVELRDEHLVRIRIDHALPCFSRQVDRPGAHRGLDAHGDCVVLADAIIGAGELGMPVAGSGTPPSAGIVTLMKPILGAS